MFSQTDLNRLGDVVSLDLDSTVTGVGIDVIKSTGQAEISEVNIVVCIHPGNLFPWNCHIMIMFCCKS